MMLNEIAFRIAESTFLLPGLALSFVILGFAFSVVRYVNLSFVLGRSRYLLYFGILVFLSSSSQLLWILGPAAISTGTLWILVSTVLVLSFLFGMGFGSLASGRSRDAFGDGSAAWIGIIPFVNLILLFKGSKNPRREHFASRLADLAACVVGATTLIIGLTARGPLEKFTERLASTASEHDAAFQMASLELNISTYGIEKVIRDVALQTPRTKIDEITKLLDLRADGRSLLFKYEVTEPDRLNKAILGDILTKNACENNLAFTILASGGELHHLYLSADSTAVFEKRIVIEDCASQ